MMGTLTTFVVAGPFRSRRCTALAEYGILERPGCATHPTHTSPNQSAAGQSPDTTIPRSAVPCGMKLLGFLGHVQGK